jgi:cobalamin synthase
VAADKETGAQDSLAGPVAVAALAPDQLSEVLQVASVTREALALLAAGSVAAVVAAQAASERHRLPMEATAVQARQRISLERHRRARMSQVTTHSAVAVAVAPGTLPVALAGQVEAALGALPQHQQRPQGP